MHAHRVKRPTPAQVEKSMTQLESLWRPAVQPQDGMTPAQLQAHIDILRRALASAEAVSTSCGSCINFRMDYCTVHEAKVPVEFAKTPGACGEWKYDGIPF